MKKLLGATALMAALMFTPALGGDLGGNCCADLEERVSELEATVANKGNRKMKLVVYGQVNMAFMHFEAGDYRDDAVADNGVSDTRFGFKGSAKIGKGASAGFRIEVGVGVNRLERPGLAGDQTLDVRRANLFLELPVFGTATLGRANQAAYGVSTIDLSKASVAARRLSLDPVGERFADGLSPNDLPFQGGQRNIVKWTSKDIGGFTLSAHWGEDDEWGVALRYAGELGKQFRLAAGLGYTDVDTSNAFGARESQTFTAGGSIMHVPTGLFIGGSYGKFEGDLDFFFGGVPAFAASDITLTAWAVNGGIERKFFEIGKTTFYGEYQEFELDGFSGTPTIYGLGVVQSIDAAAMDLYAGYRHGDLDISGASTGDQLLVGGRIRF